MYSKYKNLESDVLEFKSNQDYKGLAMYYEKLNWDLVNDNTSLKKSNTLLLEECSSVYAKLEECEKKLVISEKSLDDASSIIKFRDDELKRLTLVLDKVFV